MDLATLFPTVLPQRVGEPELNAGLEPYPGYRLCRFLGRGGCGEVWEAETPTGRAALKLMQCGPGRPATDEMRSIQLMRQLSHPNLLRTDRVWAYQNYLVVAMELATISLEDLCRAYQDRFGKLILPEHVCLCLAQVAAALDFCNARQHRVNGQRVGVQHCDVKPSNFLLCGGQVKLSDFGLASALSSPLKSHRRAGSPEFSAAEVFQGQLSDRTDQYALAVSYCWLRGGRLPFTNSPGDFKSKYIRPAPDLSMLSRPEQPIVARALAPAPRDRWPSCGELIARLSEAVSS
jgi:serine/threonine-protein kinase